MNTSGSFTRGIKRPGLEADHSPPTSDEIKNEWSYASTTPTHLHGVYRDNFSCSYFCIIIPEVSKVTQIYSLEFAC